MAPSRVLEEQLIDQIIETEIPKIKKIKKYLYRGFTSVRHLAKFCQKYLNSLTKFNFSLYLFSDSLSKNLSVFLLFLVFFSPLLLSLFDGLLPQTFLLHLGKKLKYFFTTIIKYIGEVSTKNYFYFAKIYSTIEYSFEC